MLIEAQRLSVLGAPISRVVEIDFVSTPDVAWPAVVQPSKFNNNFALDRVIEISYISYVIESEVLDTYSRTTSDGELRVTSDGNVRSIYLLF